MSNYRQRGYLLERFRLFHLHTAPQTQVDYHYHEFCKILLLLSGGGEYYVDGQRYLLQAGDIILLNSHSVHRPDMDAGAPCERIIIYIDPGFLQRSSTEKCDLLSVFSADKGHVLRLPESRRRKLFQLAATLEEHLNGTDFGQDSLSSTSLLGLLVELGRARQRDDVFDSGSAMPQSDRICEIIRYIDSHLSDDLNIDELAQRFFISKFHMMRLFRQETGTTVHLYLTQKRLMLARSLIDGGMRATEACYRSGFRSYSSFTRACAKYLGTTPTGRLDTHYVRAETPE
jgi:AraC-like DNA-binding protein